mmetsp:Transcript_125655/g.298295  ORF Transcript_125655/g.298295 Transcript_125655/m.298295 type:complete len:202 (-) Transcript_125655:40-645(-)
MIRRWISMLALCHGIHGREIAILPDAKLVGEDLASGASGASGVAFGMRGASGAITNSADPMVPETIEDVEARWLGTALSQVGWFLSEPPLALGQKATSWALNAEKPHAQTQHQSLALSVLSLLGVSLHEHKHRAHAGAAGIGVVIPEHKHTMFGGIPWLLILPVVLGVGLATFIQVVSLYYEWLDTKDKMARGEPLEPDGY